MSNDLVTIEDLSRISGTDNEIITTSIEVQNPETAVLPSTGSDVTVKDIRDEAKFIRDNRHRKAIILTVEEMMQIDPNYRPKTAKPTQCSLERAEELLKDLQPVVSVVQEAQDVINEKTHRVYVRRMLEDGFQLEESEESHQLFKAETRHITEASRSKDGEKYGSITGFGESCAGTQATMKTKKKSSAAASLQLKGGLQNIKALLQVREEPSLKSMTVHFLFRATKRQVIDLNSTFVGITLKDLVIKKKNIIDTLSEDYDAEEGIPNNVCYYVHDALKGKENRDYSSFRLRLHLDKQKMYASRLTPVKIATIIRKNKEVSKDIEIVPSSFEDAFIDVVTQRGTNENASRTSLHYITYGKLKLIQLKGSPKIEFVSPKEVSLKTFFKGIRKPYYWETVPEGRSVLEFDLMMMANHNYPELKYFTESLALAGIKVVSELKKKYTERVYAFVIDFDIYEGKNILTKKLIRINADYKDKFTIDVNGDTARLEFEGDANLEPIVEQLKTEFVVLGIDENTISLKLTKLQNIGQAFKEIDRKYRKYVYADVLGSDMKFVVSHPWVDTSRIVTNSVPIMAQYFGIEAARNYFIYDYTANKDAINAKSQPRFSFVIADDITFWGKPYGTTFYENAKKRDVDPITLAAMGQPGKTYAKNASKKVITSITPTTVSIMVRGEVFAGNTKVNVIRPDKNKLYQGMKESRTQKRVLNRNISLLVSQANQKISTARNLPEPAVLSTIQPSIMPDLKESNQKPVKFVRGDYSTTDIKASFTYAPQLKALEGTVLISRSLETTEMRADVIVTDRECRELTRIVRTSTEKVKFLQLIKERPQEQITRRIQRGYMAIEEDSDVEEEMEELTETIIYKDKFVDFDFKPPETVV